MFKYDADHEGHLGHASYIVVYSKTCLMWHLKNKHHNGLKDKW